MDDTTRWRRHLVEDEESQWFDSLFAPQQAAIKDLIDEPDVDKLVADELFVAVARADVLPRLLTWFTPAEGHGWQHHPERSGSIGEASAAVEWTFTGSYERERLDPAGATVDNDGCFNGVRALGQSISLDGITLMSIEDDAFVVRRYIDWVGLYAQLGLSVNWRVPQGAGAPDPPG